MEKPEIVCPQCHAVQPFTKNQNKCKNGCLWSNWFCARVAESLGFAVRHAGL